MRLVIFENDIPYELDDVGFYIQNLSTCKILGPMSEEEATKIKTALEDGYDYSEYNRT